MSNFNLEIPINNLSLGQVGYGVVYEIYKRGLSPNIFLIGNPDLRSFNQDVNFQYWLDGCLKKAQREFTKDQATISLWHISGSHKRITNKSILWTVHECDTLTPTEINILSKHDQVLVTSNYSKEVFNSYGIGAEVCPNYFDHLHFKPIEVPKPDAITFGVFGKLEKRKHTRNTIVSWANQFGNKKEYRLVCCIWNAFINNDLQAQEINHWFGGKCPYNITFLNFQEKNEEYNKILNSIDVGIFLSGAEGFNIPALTCLALGKQCIVLNAHAHKDFATEENAILVEPSGKEDISDGIFFQKGAEFNQGEMYKFSQEDAHEAYEKAVDKIKNGCIVNEAGFRLQEDFSVKNTVDTLLSYL